MIYGNNQTIEDKVVEILSVNGMTAKALGKELEKDGRDFTIQGIYKALRKLMEDNVVLKHSTKYILSKEWIQKTTRSLSNNLLLEGISVGESSFYRFKSLSHLDAHWKHLIISIQNHYSGFPTFFATPHEMWAYLGDRRISEIEYLQDFEKEKRFGFLVLGGNTPLDMKLRKEFQNDYLQIDASVEITIKHTHHLTIIGDFVVITKITGGLAEKIDRLYKNVSEEDLAIKKLQEIFKNPGHLSVKLENNPKKARALRKKLSKNFYIPKEIIEKYDLF